MYLLIVGSPRSGTTLFATMIGMHSDVAMLIEDRFLGVKRLTGKKVLANKLCIPNQVELTKRANYASRALRKVGLFTGYTSSRFNVQDYLKLESIKILTIIRDGNDVISSIMKRGQKEKQIAQRRWSRAIEIMYELNTRYPDKTAAVSYEDLVTEPESVLKKVAEFIGIEYQPQMLEGYKHNMLYPGESGIDKTKAFKSKQANNNNSNGIPPAISDMYNKLLHLKINP